MKMPLKIVRGLDIRTVEEEKLIQEVVNARTSIAQPVVKFNQIVPDIKNVEQEKEWQAKIDKFNAEHAPVEAKIAEAEKKLETVKSEVTSVSNNIPDAPLVATSGVVVPTVIVVQDGKIIKPFCDKCDSKGRFHKKDCPVKQNADISTSSV